MKPIKIIIINTLLSFTIISATGAWMMNQRTHGEIKWKTLKTENFDIHYYEKIEKIAHQGATIAEQIRPVLMEQMGIDELPRLSIAFTEEDESEETCIQPLPRSSCVGSPMLILSLSVTYSRMLLLILTSDDDVIFSENRIILFRDTDGSIKNASMLQIAAAAAVMNDSAFVITDN